MNTSGVNLRILDADNRPNRTFNVSHYDSQQIEPTNTVSYYGGTHEGFGQTASGVGYNNASRSHFIASRSSSKESIKIL